MANVPHQLDPMQEEELQSIQDALKVLSKEKIQNIFGDTVDVVFKALNEYEDMVKSRLPEKPVGICPACMEPVFISKEGDAGPVWTCPTDLRFGNPYWEPSLVTEEMKEKSGFYGNCPVEHGRYPGLDHGFYVWCNHLPLHGSCYDKGGY